MPDPFSPATFERFFDKVQEAPPPSTMPDLGMCWLWTAYRDHDGYGRFHCPGFPAINGGAKTKTVPAHRWATAFWYGAAVLHGLTYDHLCRRTNCVNPRHGSAISASENIARGNALRHEPLPDDPFEVFEF